MLSTSRVDQFLLHAGVLYGVIDDDANSPPLRLPSCLVRAFCCAAPAFPPIPFFKCFVLCFCIAFVSYFSGARCRAGVSFALMFNFAGFVGFTAFDDV